jgi:diguanylate cyclase (GGDEF)-like protein
MAYLAWHDPLTGLVNRRAFEKGLRELVADAQTGGGVHALLYLDLDQFKLINDSCGHTAGDEVLKQLPALWLERLGTGPMLARIGGDEFGVLLRHCAGSEVAVALAEDLRRIVTGYRFSWSGRSFILGASIGVAMIDAAATDSAGVLAAADTACLTAKEQGRNRVRVYELSDSEVARQVSEREWVQRVREALEEERFELYYQDIVPVRKGAGETPHIEILVRMINEAGGIEMPGSFIPTAEHYGLMPDLDRLVIRKSLAWLASRAGEAVICSINLSGLSLSDEALLEYIQHQFEVSGAEPDRVCFEITETAAIAQLTRADRLIGELKRLGCLFSLDDFGSGLSSFRYLKHLPVDYLKIDGSFVREMARDHIDRAMVESIHHLGRRLDIRTVAEFVENDSIFVHLEEIGVDYAQGYAISRPAPLAGFAPVRR